MRGKPILLLVVALGCGMVAAVAASKAVVGGGNGQAAEEMVEIFVAVKDLPHAQKVTAENIRLEKWPRKRLPEGALVNLEQLEGKFTNQGIFAGEPILDRKLSESRDSLSTGMPEGYRIFNFAGGANVYIKPGDHIDIYGTFQLGGRNGSLESRMVMENVAVHAINGITIRDSDDLANSRNLTFQLLVRESQLEALTLANRMGELELHLRPMGEAQGTVQTDNGESFLQWVEDSRAPEPSLLTSTEPTRPAVQEEAVPAGEEVAHEMLIMTPNGVRRYQWNDKNSFPQLLEDSSRGMGSHDYNGETQNSSQNVPEGYGGYAPTYPNSDEIEHFLQGEDSLPPGEDEPKVLQRRRH